jgi:hypothetical protein
MSIGLEIETETQTETETTKEIRLKPSLIENRMRFLLSKDSDNSIKRVKDLGRMMALFDPNGC